MYRILIRGGNTVHTNAPKFLPRKHLPEWTELCGQYAAWHDPRVQLVIGSGRRESSVQP